MADEDRDHEEDDAAELRTGRISRSAASGGLVAGQSLKWAGTRAANLVRGEERSTGYRRLDPAFARELIELGGSPRSPHYEQMNARRCRPLLS